MLLKGLFPTRFSSTQKICLSGLLIGLVMILQKILAINYIPIIPFLRISLGGPALIIFSSILLGPIYGFAIGAISDILGYFLLDPKMMGFLPQITAIYALLGYVSFFIYLAFRKIKNEKLMLIIEGATFALILAGVALYLFLQSNLQLYGSTYTLELWQKILIPSIMLVLFVGLFVSSILFNNHYKKDDIQLNPIAISFSNFLIEILVMVAFGTLMKGLAFGFATYPMILICQLLVLFINIPLNTWLVILFLKLTNRFFLVENKEVYNGDTKYARKR